MYVEKSIDHPYQDIQGKVSGSLYLVYFLNDKK